MKEAFPEARAITKSLLRIIRFVALVIKSFCENTTLFNLIIQ